MRRAINADCTGEPPGELIASATDFTLKSLKARSSVPARPANESPPRKGPTWLMTPLNRTTATTGGGLRNRSMGSSARSS